MKNRYLLMAQDYMRLADLRERAHAYRTPATVEENAAWAATVTGRFPAPWRIVEIPHGFAVDDATRQQVAVFYGLAEPNTARQTDFLTIDEARQMAVDFAKLPELLEQTSGRSEVATSPADDGLAKLETNRSPQGASETSRLPRAAQLSVITVTGLPLVKAPTTIRRSISFVPDRRRSTQMLRRPPLSNGIKFLSAGAIAGLLAGYFVFGRSDRPVDVAVAPQPTTDIPPVAFLPLREVAAPPAEARDITVESRAEPEVQTTSLPPAVRLDIKPTESEIDARPRQTSPEGGTQSEIEAGPPQTLPERGRQFFAANRHDPTCYPSASAVRQHHPGGWPSWTLRAPGHEGIKCWYAAGRTTAHDHRSAMVPMKETVGTTEKFGAPGVLSGVRAADQGNADAQNSLTAPAPRGQPNIGTSAASIASSGTTQQDGEAATQPARVGAADRVSERALNPAQETVLNPAQETVLNPAQETVLNPAQETGLNEGVLQARACIRDNIRAAYQSSESVDQVSSFLMRSCFGPFSAAIPSGEASATTLFKRVVIQEISPDDWLRTLKERAARGR
jgi:hypothetical protein